MKNGFTTGSCAAAAAKAATWLLLTGRKLDSIRIITPRGIPYDAQICDSAWDGITASCSVVKDGGDDPDCTTGVHVVCSVTIEEKYEGEEILVDIDGGEGVGRVTLPGLDQPVGNAAINTVPRKMIEEEVRDVCILCDFSGKLKVVVSVPEGREIAKRTFNPRLGIRDGISILGTSGIVEPMSSQALLDTIRVELNQKKSLGNHAVCITPGNYGLEFMKKNFSYDLDRAVKCSNFIGASIDMAVELGFKKILLCGHIGKLVKLAGGIWNTHSREADCRMELLASAAIRAGCSVQAAGKILDCVTTEEGINVLIEEGICDGAMENLLQKVMFNLENRCKDVEIGCMIYCNQFGMLAQSDNAHGFLREVM